MHGAASGQEIARSLETALVHAIIILVVGGFILGIVLTALSARRRNRARRSERERRKLVRAIRRETMGDNDAA